MSIKKEATANMSSPIYLDNSTTSRPSQEAISQMLTYFSDQWGTLSQPHALGQNLYPAIEKSYKEIYKLLGASDKETFVLTSSSAEAINQVFLSTYLSKSLHEGKNHFISTNFDEAPSMLSLHRIEELGGAATMIKPDSHGHVTVKALTEVITPRTALLAISLVNGITGVVQPLQEIAELCHLRGIYLLVDVTHAIGKIPFKFESLPIDFAVFNGSQLHAPQGTGGIMVKHGLHLLPLIVGGIEQIGLRAGSLNVPSLIAMGVCAKQAQEAQDYIGSEIARLKFQFERGILEKISGAKVLFEKEERAPHITCITFPGVANEALAYALQKKELYCSLGGGSQQQISYLLETLGIPAQEANTALSFALSRETTESQIEKAIEEIVLSYEKLKKISGDLV